MLIYYTTLNTAFGSASNQLEFSSSLPYILLPVNILFWNEESKSNIILYDKVEDQEKYDTIIE